MQHVQLWLTAIALAITPAFVPVALDAQQATARIHGHVNDPAGIPMANVQVVLSPDGKTAEYSFTTDQNGDYTGDNIAPNGYVVTLFQSPGKAVDRFLNIKIDAGQNTRQDFDLSRPDYLAKLSPEMQKDIADAKAKNEAIKQGNQDINKLNDMLKQAREDDAQKKYDDAATLMQQAVALKGDVGVLWLQLGVAQSGQKKYSDAVVSLQKAIDLDTASKKPNPEVEGAAYNDLGEAYAALSKIPEASVAYEAAVRLVPANASSYYTNEAIVLGKTGNTDATVAAADKAIAADPTKPVPYYLKGQALVSKASIDPKTRQIVTPPGTAEAYREYLGLAPNGPMSATAKSMLAAIGEPVSVAPQTTTTQNPQSSDADAKRQEIADKIDELQSDMEEHQSAAETWDETASNVLDTSSCNGPGLAICQAMGRMGAIKAQSNASKERAAANADQAEINRLGGEAAAIPSENQAPAGQSTSGAPSGSGSSYDPNRHYSGPNAGMVQSLLDSSPGWSCPSSISQSIKWTPPIQQVCMRDSYVTAAVAAAYGAECEARLGRNQEAEQDAESMASSVKSAKSMCSNAPYVANRGPGCSTLQIVPCP